MENKQTYLFNLLKSSISTFDHQKDIVIMKFEDGNLDIAIDITGLEKGDKILYKGIVAHLAAKNDEELKKFIAQLET